MQQKGATLMDNINNQSCGNIAATFACQKPAEPPGDMFTSDALKKLATAKQTDELLTYHDV